MDDQMIFIICYVGFCLIYASLMALAAVLDAKELHNRLQLEEKILWKVSRPRRSHKQENEDA